MGLSQPNPCAIGVRCRSTRSPNTLGQLPMAESKARQLCLGSAFPAHLHPFAWSSSPSPLLQGTAPLPGISTLIIKMPNLATRKSPCHMPGQSLLPTRPLDTGIGSRWTEGTSQSVLFRGIRLTGGMESSFLSSL